MEITAFQRKALEEWRRMKPEGLTWRIAMRRLAWSWSILGVATAAVYLIFPQIGALVTALVLGTCIRDLGYVRSARAVWPVSFAVIDWTKVDALLEDDKS